jgi:DNA excision repair protein ERCC-2
VNIYNWLLCQKLGLSAVNLALVYFDIGTRKETLLTEPHSDAALRQYFEAQ